MAPIPTSCEGELRQASKSDEHAVQSWGSSRNLRHNPIRLVRLGAKRRKIPIVLTSDEVRRLMEALPLRERTLVLLAAGTGLRMSELFGLKWSDVHFDRHEISVSRSIVMQVVALQDGGIPKADSHGPSSRRSPGGVACPVALPSRERLGFRQCKVARALAILGAADHAENNRHVAVKLGISGRLGWHTFRHTFSTLLRATGADIKVMQELLRHASARVTLDTYTQAVSDKKRRAQTKVVRLLIPWEARKK